MEKQKTTPATNEPATFSDLVINHLDRGERALLFTILEYQVEAIKSLVGFEPNNNNMFSAFAEYLDVTAKGLREKLFGSTHVDKEDMFTAFSEWRADAEDMAKA